MKTLAIAAALAGVAAPAAAQEAAELSSSIDHREGDYGTGESVETTTLRTTLRVESGGAFVYGSLPYHRVEAPGNVVGGSGLLGLPIVIDPTRPAARETREGIGDLRVGAGYRLPPVAGVNLALLGELKLPTASARRGLGTGETDLLLGAEAARPIGAVTPFVALSYTIPGDPEGYRLRDSLAARGGLVARLAPGLSGTLAYSHAESVSAQLPDERLVTSALEVALSRRLSLGVEGSAGMSDGAADIGAALRIGWRIF